MCSRTQTRCLVVARRTLTPSPRQRTTRRLPTRTRAPQKSPTRRPRARSSSHRMAFAIGPQGRLRATFTLFWSRCLHFFLYLLIASVFWSRSKYFLPLSRFVAELFPSCLCLLLSGYFGSAAMTSRFVTCDVSWRPSWIFFFKMCSGFFWQNFSFFYFSVLSETWVAIKRKKISNEHRPAFSFGATTLVLMKLVQTKEVIWFIPSTLRVIGSVVRLG